MEHRANVSVVSNPCLKPGCHRRGVYRRGLCDKCYDDRDLRELHAAQPRSTTSRGVGDNTARRVLPEPTEALPGTPEKLAVLVSRAANDEQLWHPLDAGRDDRTTLARVVEQLVERAFQAAWQ